MFEVAELGRSIDKDAYNETVPHLRTELLAAQRALRTADFPVLILLNGMDAAGKGDTANILTEWLDVRDLETYAYSEPTEEQAQRPDYWRHWMELPPRGRIGLFIGSWYARAIVGRALGKVDELSFSTAIDKARRFEQTLADDGALIIKFWFHISRKEQAKRLEQLSEDKTTRWRITKRDWMHNRHYDDFRKTAERALRATSTGHAPWTIVEGTDARYRNITVAREILRRINSHSEARQEKARGVPEQPIDDPFTILDRIDLSQSVDSKKYNKELGQLQAKLFRLGRKLQKRQKRCIMLFEGWDAAGKGGCIRRIIHPLDARQFRVIPIAAPTDEERAHHYLWRFWRHLPRLGRFTIYDRSWYGRVLVERVEGFAAANDWQRAYSEINDFESELLDDGRTVLCKFWLHISQEEQMRRFQERERIPYKQHKITEEDYRNREKANLYEKAAEEMVARTSTENAPWTLIAAEDKKFGRLQVLRTVCDRLEKAL